MTGKHRNQTCRCTFSSYYCTRKPDYYDSTQDGHRGKTSTLPKIENQGAAAQDFRLVWQVQWRRDHRQSITEEVRQDLRRPVMIWHKEDLTIHWLCICCVILSTYNRILDTSAPGHFGTKTNRHPDNSAPQKDKSALF
jgi:hypothetical protein